MTSGQYGNNLYQFVLSFTSSTNTSKTMHVAMHIFHFTAFTSTWIYVRWQNVISFICAFYGPSLAFSWSCFQLLVKHILTAEFVSINAWNYPAQESEYWQLFSTITGLLSHREFSAKVERIICEDFPAAQLRTGQGTLLGRLFIVIFIW